MTPTAQPTSDKTTLLTDIKTAVNEAMSNIDATKLSVQISPQIHIKNNNEVFDAVSLNWNQ